MNARNTGGISGAGAKNVNSIYKELGVKIPTLKEFEKEIRSKKLPDNRKYETTPKGVKKNMNNLSNKILKSFGINN